MRYVFDLDNTLASDMGRRKYLEQIPKDWDAYYLNCENDEPLPALQILDDLYMADHRIEIWTGRGDIARPYTDAWITRHTGIITMPPVLIPPATVPDFVVLRMRRHGDYMPDVDLKRQWLEEARAAGRVPDLVFEDRTRCVDMWRAEGIPCFQVAPGDF